MVVGLFVLALCQTGDLSRVYPASPPKVVGIGTSRPLTLIRISRRKWMDRPFEILLSWSFDFPLGLGGGEVPKDKIFRSIIEEILLFLLLHW